MRLRRLLIPVLAVAPATAGACDLCSVYTAGMARGETSGWFTGVSEQFTRYDELRDEGHRIDADSGQYLDSSITQLFLGYGFSDRFAMQVNVPYIHRSFKRPEGETIEKGTESGIGDVAAVAQYTLVRHDDEDSNWLWRVLGGVKFGTGDMGAEMGFTFGPRWSLDLRADVPVDTDNSSIQTTASYRLRAAVVATF